MSSRRLSTCGKGMSMFMRLQRREKVCIKFVREIGSRLCRRLVLIRILSVSLKAYGYS
jgi:hypothetical protein